MNVTAARAALENARWCDLVCRAHGVPTVLEPSSWIALGPVPRHYPRLMTLGGPDRAGAHLAAAGALLEREQGSALAVKDSFGALDLAPLGLARLFEAEWIARPPEAAPPGMASGSSWMRVGDAAGLVRWESAWGGAPGGVRLFPPALLSTPGLDFVAVEREGEIVATCVLHRSDGVVGFSNAGGEYETALRAAVDAARERHPGLPLVGYEHGDDLVAALEAGFRRRGPLVVWERAPRAAD